MGNGVTRERLPAYSPFGRFVSVLVGVVDSLAFWVVLGVLLGVVGMGTVHLQQEAKTACTAQSE